MEERQSSTHSAGATGHPQAKLCMQTQSLHSS